MIALPFILNSVFNFAVGLLVAKVLGPTEYGRYALAMSIAIVMQTLGFDWLRLCATRYYSAQDRLERPEIRATLDLVFIGAAAVLGLAAVAVALSGISLPLSTGLVMLAVCVAIANGLFDISAALLRARFLNRPYGLFVIGKNLLAACLIVGGSWYFKSAIVALAGLTLSIAGSFALSHRVLMDGNARPRLAERRVALKFVAYGLPIVLANVLYQAVPMINRGAVSHQYGFAEAGQLALAFDLGIRIVGSIGSALDVLLFQVAVLAEKTFGAQAARSQVSRNMGLVFAIILPAVAGFWLILPSFECVFVPVNFQGPFAHYFTLMLPAVLSFALINYFVAPAFQIANHTRPLIVGGAVALLADWLALSLLPASPDASAFATAQSISSCAGLATLLAFMRGRDRMLPRFKDVAGASVGVLAMLAAVRPLRDAMPAGPTTMLIEAGAGICVYGCFVFAFDVSQIRGMLLPRLTALRGRRTHETAPAGRARVSDGFVP